MQPGLWVMASLNFISPASEILSPGNLEISQPSPPEGRDRETGTNTYPLAWSVERSMLCYKIAAMSANNSASKSNRRDGPNRRRVALPRRLAIA
jgi:hypothetical protein